MGRKTVALQSARKVLYALTPVKSALESDRGAFLQSSPSNKMTKLQPQIPLLYIHGSSRNDCYFSTLYNYTLSGQQHFPIKGDLYLRLIISAFMIRQFWKKARIKRQISYFARDTLYKGLFGKGLLLLRYNSCCSRKC